MSNKLYEENDIQNIANAIRNKNGTEDTYKVSQMSTAIDSIEVIEQAIAEGESLSLTNTKAMPYSDYVVEGKSEQETGKTKNFLNSLGLTTQTINGVTFTPVYENNSLQYININGTATDRADYKFVNYVTYNPNTYDLQKINTNSGISVMLVTKGGSVVKSASLTKEIFTITENTECLGWIRIYSGTTINNEKIYPQVKLSSITDDTYEPYGEKPSPSIPSEIHSVADDVNLWNGNILSLNNATYSNGIVTQTTADTASNIVWKFNALNNSSFVRQLDTQIKNNTGILDFTFIKDNTFNVLLFGLNGSTRDTTIRISLADLIDDETYTLSFNVTNVTQGSISWQDIKLQKGTEATSYSPYNQGTVTIKQRGTTENNDYTIQTEPLRSLPNGVKDTIEADGIHRRVGRIVLDGTESGGKSGYSNDTYSVFYTNDYNNLLSNDILLVSNYFINDNNIGTTSSITKEAIGYKTSDYGIRISILKSKADTFADFQAWLSTHNTEVLYPLAEEVIEPLTQNQATTMLDIIKTGSYEGTTNIDTDEDVKPTMKVGYYKKG